MSIYGDDHDGHVCERCDQEYLLRDDAEPTRWCDECAQKIAEDLTTRLAAAEDLNQPRMSLHAEIARLQKLLDEHAETVQRYKTKYEQEKADLQKAEDRLRKYEPEPGKCEHGVDEGDWCEPCNRAYKEAADEAAKGGRDE